MKTLQPIGIEIQVENVLFGTPQTETDRVKEKVKLLIENINKIEKVNGTKVYDIIIDEDYNNIYYNLKPTPNVFKYLIEVTENKTVHHTRKYYYPIQYAKIELSN